VGGRDAAGGIGDRRTGPVGRTGQAAGAEPQFGVVDHHSGRGCCCRCCCCRRLSGGGLPALLLLADGRRNGRRPAAVQRVVRGAVASAGRPSADGGGAGNGRRLRPLGVLLQISAAATATARLERHFIALLVEVHHVVVVHVNRPQVLDAPAVGLRRVTVSVRNGRVLHVDQYQPFPGVKTLAVHVPAGRTPSVAAHHAGVQFGGARIFWPDGRGPHDAFADGHATLFVVLLLVVDELVRLLLLLLLEQLFHGRRGGRAEQVGEMSHTVETHCVPSRSHSTTTATDDVSRRSHASFGARRRTLVSRPLIAFFFKKKFFFSIYIMFVTRGAVKTLDKNRRSRRRRVKLLLRFFR